ncbi:small subunit processome component 20 homolog [Diadema antillarum]|uniref:small subunit processome component 20 homolog n=1 Tax=Diadema antillarum TaxID=105358 RepID=UPI003A8793C1
MLLKNMAPRLKPGDLDSCLESLLQIFNQELFGAVSEEKEVEGIVGKLPEARSIKAYDCYEMVSKVAGQGSITKMITPLKEVLDTSHSHRASNRVRETLRRCAIGLQENAGITQEALLIFIHGLTSETLPLMNKTSKSEVSEAITPKEGQRPPSTYLLPPTPTRAGIVPETSAKTHHHLLVEFGLQLLNMSLKRSKLVASNEQHLSMLDPFTLILIKSMESQHTRVISMALRCLCWLLRYPLPTLDELIKQLTQILFRLLRKYARAGAAKGDNFELMVVTFKAMTVLIRDVKQHTINEKQLQVLLAYAEEDIHDHTRQATAFGLLKAILSRKLVSPEMNGIMEKVSQLSITSTSPSARIQCREVMHQFLLDYPLGKKLKRHLEFYVKQLSFSIETGRESALEMLATIYSTFPQKLLMEHAGLFFIPMATRLVNDDSAKCRKLTALALVTLLKKLTLEKRDDLFAVTLQWLKDAKRSHQRLAAQLSGLFVDCEKETFSRHLSQILPVIDETIKPENFKEEEEEEDGEVKAQDHLLFHLMATLSKITKHFHLTTYKDQQTVVNSIWESVEAHLVHPHAWVRLMACRLFGEMFANLQPDDVVTTATIAKSSVTPVTSAAAGTKKKKQKRGKKLTSKQEEPEVQTQGMDVSKTRNSSTRVQEKFEYLQGDVEKRMLGLANKFCVQLNSSMVTKELAEQVVKNLIFVSKVVHRLHPVPQPSPFKRKKGSASKEEAQEEDGDDAEDVVCPETEEQDTKLEENRDAESLTIEWLVRKMSHIAATEVAKTAKVTLRRSSVIKWMAATALEVGQGLVEPLLPSMLQVVAREMNDKASHGDAELRVLCQEVMELLKGLVGLETFSNIYAAVQRNASENRLARKRKRALEAVANPDKAAERRMRIQQLKKEARKRKLQALRPTYHINKRPRLKGR